MCGLRVGRLHNILRCNSPGVYKYIYTVVEKTKKGDIVVVFYKFIIVIYFIGARQMRFVVLSFGNEWQRCSRLSPPLVVKLRALSCVGRWKGINFGLLGVFVLCLCEVSFHFSTRFLTQQLKSANVACISQSDNHYSEFFSANLGRASNSSLSQSTHSVHFSFFFFPPASAASMPIGIVP